MKKLNRKGFTIVELVIVIAVIAILAAVLIPTFSNIIQSANESSDTQLVRNLNTIVATDKATNGTHKTYQQVLDVVGKSGYDVAKIMTAKATDNEILWDSKNDVFCYLNDGAVEYIPNSTTGEPLTTGDYRLWKIYADSASANAGGEAYSVYLAGDTLTGEITVTGRGIDVGNNTGITTVNYNGASDAHDVVIRTNSMMTTLTINAKVGDTAETSDSVAHYDKAGKLVVESMYTASYHEYGTVAFAEIQKGRVVAEQGGHIEVAIVTAEATVAFAQENGGTIGVAYATSEANKTANNNDSTKKELTYLESADTVAEAETKASEYKENALAEEAVADNADAKVRIGGKGYTSIYDAVTAAQSGDTIKLLYDCSQDNLNLAQSKNITLDLNGKTLTVGGDDGNTHYGIRVNSGATLTITDSGSNGKIVNNNGNAQTSAGAYIPVIDLCENSTLIVNSGTIERTIAGVAIYAQTGSVNVTINGGTIKAVSDGIRISGGTLTITGGTIFGTTNSLDVGNSVTTNISGGTFDGGFSCTPTTVTGGTFTAELTYVGSLYASKATGLNADKYVTKVGDSNQAYYKFEPSISDSDAPYIVRATNVTAESAMFAWVVSSNLSSGYYAYSSYTKNQVTDYTEVKDVFEIGSLPTLSSNYKYVNIGDGKFTVQEK